MPEWHYALPLGGAALSALRFKYHTDRLQPLRLIHPAETLPRRVGHLCPILAFLQEPALSGVEGVGRGAACAVCFRQGPGDLRRFSLIRCQLRIWQRFCAVSCIVVTRECASAMGQVGACP